jgi:ABC-type phosphate/phosphonate transport system substrate-binding protein
MAPLRFAVATTPQSGTSAFLELRTILATEVTPVFVPSYGALFEAVRSGATDVAWCPPLVARDLQRAGAAEPVAALIRNGADHYYSAIVVGPGSSIQDVKEVAGTRFGWVSQMSAAGYIVPRAHLRSLGVELSFREERFFHTHARSMAALQAGAVDVVATYASARGFEGSRTVATIGPIPGDVVVVAASAAPELKQTVGAALQGARVEPGGPLATLLAASVFGPVPPGHLDTLSKWVDEALFHAP